MSAEEKLIVATPAGDIKVLPSGGPKDYPGVRIVVNNSSVVYVEYDNVKDAIHVVTYDHTSDEPRDIYKVEKEEYTC